MTDDKRHPTVADMAAGLIAHITGDGLTEKNRERIHFCLLASYEQGIKDGQELAKVLAGKHVYFKRRPPPHLDPTSAYDS